MQNFRFNSTLVQLKEYEVYLLYRIKASFNSTLVQLKDGCLLSIPLIIHRFNSTLVQLKGWYSAGAIERLISIHRTISSNLFQFYLSSIKSSAGVSGVGNPTAFQFYLSSIKSGSGQGSVDFSSEFQFYLSSIKSYENVS